MRYSEFIRSFCNILPSCRYSNLLFSYSDAKVCRCGILVEVFEETAHNHLSTRAYLRCWINVRSWPDFALVVA